MKFRACSAAWASSILSTPRGSHVGPRSEEAKRRRRVARLRLVTRTSYVTNWKQSGRDSRQGEGQHRRRAARSRSKARRASWTGRCRERSRRAWRTTRSRSRATRRLAASRRCTVSPARWSTTWSLGVSDGLRQEPRNRRRRFQGRGAGQNLNLSLGFSHPILFPDSRRTSRSPWRKTPRSAIEGIDKKTGRPGRRGYSRATIRRSLTRAKVFVTPASRSAARKAKPFNSLWLRSIAKQSAQRIHKRIRKKVSGTAERPRLCRSFLRQACLRPGDRRRSRQDARLGGDDREGIRRQRQAAANRATAEKVGKADRRASLAKKIDKVVFDRGGFIYHGKVKALADAAREGGLKF